jgi:hypothetical protein
MMNRGEAIKARPKVLSDADVDAWRVLAPAFLHSPNVGYWGTLVKWQNQGI